MKFDYAKTLSLVKGGLTDHEATWKEYLEDCPDWQSTSITLTGPLILVTIILDVIFSRITGGFSPYGYYSNFFSAIFWGLILASLGFVIAVFVFNFLAGTFKGNSNFSRAFAAVSLAAIPSWLAGIVAALIPGFFIGGLIALAGGIVSLVFMYKILPLALGIPDEKRVVHFIASIVIIIILNIVVGSIFGGGAMRNMQQADFSQSGSSSRSGMGAGMFGEIERQGRLVEAASEDRFDPPADGKLTKAQVIAYTRVLKKTRALQEDYAAKMQKLSKEIDAKEASGESPSIGDLSKIYSGIGSAVGANNAEMEIVKTGQGNWAEYTWVKDQLRVARIQQGDGSEAVAYNYKLYQKYRADIDDL